MNRTKIVGVLLFFVVISISVFSGERVEARNFTQEWANLAEKIVGDSCKGVFYDWVSYGDTDAVCAEIPLEITDVRTSAGIDDVLFIWETNKLAIGSIIFVENTTGTSTEPNIFRATSSPKVNHIASVGPLSSGALHSFTILVEDLFGNVSTSSEFLIETLPELVD